MSLFNIQGDFLITIHEEERSGEISILSVHEIFTPEPNSDVEFVQEVRRILKGQGWSAWNFPIRYHSRFSIVTGEKLNRLLRLDQNSPTDKIELEDFINRECFTSYKWWLYNHYPEWLDNNPDNPIPREFRPD